MRIDPSLTCSSFALLSAPLSLSCPLPSPSATLQAFLACGPTCILVFSPTVTKLILSADYTSGEQVYAELPSSTWSEDLRCESAAEGNQIPLLVHLPNLIKALQSCVAHDKSALRLLKRNGRAFLSISSDHVDSNQVSHEVPVQVMQAKALAECEEPMLDEPAVKINLPPVSMLASIADKMKQVSEILDIEATSDGTLTLAVNQSQVRQHSKQSNSGAQWHSSAHMRSLLAPNHPFLTWTFFLCSSLFLFVWFSLR